MIESPLSSPTLLQRVSNFKSSANLKRGSSHSETTEPPKRAWLLLSSGSSRRTLMSRLLNPKRTPRSTPILQKFSRLNLQKITPEKSDPQTTMPLLNRLTSPPPMGSRMPNMSRTPPNLIPIQTTTNPLRNRNSTSPIYHGMNLQIARQPAIATPVARKPVGYYEFTIAISPKPSSLSKSPPDCLPESLPQSSSQWERILKGDSVDLNQIFSALHLVVIDEERTGC